MSKPSPFKPCDMLVISDWTAAGPCAPTWRAPAMHGTRVSWKQTVPPSWLVAVYTGWAMTPRTDWISCRIEAGSWPFWLIGTTIKPPNWCWRQSVRIAGVSGPLKPTIITAPISCRSVIPPGPRAASSAEFAEGISPGVGVGGGAGFAVADGPTAAFDGPQPATHRATLRQRSRRMAGGSVLRGRPFRSHQPEAPQPVVSFLARRVQSRRVVLVAFPFALRQARGRLGGSQRLRGPDVAGPWQGEDGSWLTPALHLHGHRLL